MSICTTESLQSVRELDRLDAQSREAEAYERMLFDRQQVINAICKGIRTLDGIESAEIVQVLCTIENQMQSARYGQADMDAIQDLIGVLDVWRPEVSA